MIEEFPCGDKQRLFCEIRTEKLREHFFSGDDVDDAIEGEVDFEDFLCEEKIEGADGEIDKRRRFVEGKLAR